METTVAGLMHSQLSGRQVEVLAMNEAYEEIDGCFTFAGTVVVYRTGVDLHHAVSTVRHSSPSEIRVEHLSNDVVIPVSAYSPLFSPEFTPAPVPLPQYHYMKQPSLLSYDRICQGPRPNDIAESVLEEAAVCELLKRHPHPNIAEYLGCHVLEGRIAGLCFTRYPGTLMQEVNPGSLMKRASRLARQTAGPSKDYSGVLAGIESGIRHLHSLGLVHNDINPSNIMMDNEKAIIIDFGSCRQVGASMEGVGRTYEWYDRTVRTALPQNDLDALEEIHTWMDGDARPFGLRSSAGFSRRPSPKSQSRGKYLV